MAILVAGRAEGKQKVSGISPGSNEGSRSLQAVVLPVVYLKRGPASAVSTPAPISGDD